MLKIELQGMVEVRERRTELATQVSTLRQAVEKLSAAQPSETSAGSECNHTYAGAAPQSSNPSKGHDDRPRSTTKYRLTKEMSLPRVPCIANVSEPLPQVGCLWMVLGGFGVPMLFVLLLLFKVQLLS